MRKKTRNRLVGDSKVDVHYRGDDADYVFGERYLYKASTLNRVTKDQLERYRNEIRRGL